MKLASVFALLFFVYASLLTQGFSSILVSSTTPQVVQASVHVQRIAPKEAVTFSEPSPAGIPVRLRIPKIKVNAPLESVGLTKDGAVGVPSRRTHAAWFNLGPRPGDLGSAIIDGHFGWWRNGTPAVFNNLHKLTKGDKLYVEDNKGVTVTFVVRELRTYGRNANAPDVFISTDGKAHLNLITCRGIWNVFKNGYPERLVVFTDREV